MSDNNWKSALDSVHNHPSPEHFLPWLIAADDGDKVDFPVTGFEMGVISRRAIQFACRNLYL